MTQALTKNILRPSCYFLHYKKTKFLPAVTIHRENFCKKKNEARYLDPKTSRWMSADPAMYQGDYIPGAPVNDEARKRNGNLPGQGGIYNIINLHVFNYANNNPVKYTDPTGRDPEHIKPLTVEQWRIVSRVINETIEYIDQMISGISNGDIPKNLKENAMRYLGLDLNENETSSSLISDLGKIRDNLATRQRSNFLYDSKNMTYAAYYKKNDSSFTIHLTEIFFFIPDVYKSDENFDTKHGTLFHEATHFPNVLNTSDYTYKRQEACYLAAKNPMLARANATNWGMFFYYSTRGKR